jgi:hypothetical protein
LTLFEFLSSVSPSTLFKEIKMDNYETEFEVTPAEHLLFALTQFFLPTNLPIIMLVLGK